MKKLLTLFFLLATVSLMQAQERYGHLNFGNLIAMMPATEAADSELEAYQKQLVAKGETMAAAFQEEYAAFAQQVQGGDLTPIQQQEKQTALQNKQQEILSYEQEIVQLVDAKRQELLAPIIENAQNTVSAVAAENKFVMVFDTSIFGAVLFAEETEDLMPLVKAKLGLE